MAVQIIFNEEEMNAVFEKFKKAAYLAIQDVRRNVDEQQTVPFRDGTLDDSAHQQNSIVETEDEEYACVELHYSAPYAIRRYYEPANFYTGQHANATDHWLEGQEKIAKKSCQDNLNDLMARR
jgi:hypothetical protein